MIPKNPNLRLILIVITFTVILFCVVLNFRVVWDAVGKILFWFRPITVGLAIAYVLNVLLRVLEEKVFAFMQRSSRKWVRAMQRPLCLTLTVLIFLVLVAVLIAVVLPDLQSSLITVASNLPGYFDDAKAWLIGLLTQLEVDATWLEEFTVDWKQIANTLNALVPSDAGILGTASSVATTVTSSVVNFLFSMIIAIYFLAQKEKIGGFARRAVRVFLPEKAEKKIFHVLSLSHNIFTNFVRGQCAEAFILGLLTFISMVIFRFEYAGIISVVVGCTAVVPIVGALIGELFGAFLLLTVSPLRAILFFAFILILQQIEGSVIYPRVVGTSVGLPGIAVFSAVLVGGNIGGILGALLGVPVCAVLYTLLREEMDRRAQLKIHSV